jgi:hypothetical protein
MSFWLGLLLLMRLCLLVNVFLLLVWCSVACALARCLRPLSLPPSSRVARRCPPSFRAFGGAEAEAPWGRRGTRFAFSFFDSGSCLALSAGV